MDLFSYVNIAYTFIQVGGGGHYRNSGIENEGIIILELALSANRIVLPNNKVPSNRTTVDILVHFSLIHYML